VEFDVEGAEVRHSLFLQVRENWKKSENLSSEGKIGGTFFFCKSQGKVGK